MNNNQYLLYSLGGPFCKKTETTIWLFDWWACSLEKYSKSDFDSLGGFFCKNDNIIIYVVRLVGLVARTNIRNIDLFFAGRAIL